MSRKAAREIVLHSLYEYSYQAHELGDILEERLSPDSFISLSGELGAYKRPLGDPHEAYVRNVLRGIAEKLGELDDTIAKYAQNWNLERISRVTRAILRLAVYELLFVDDVPPKVSINEAVELAKKYDTPESSGFINGILASVYANENVAGKSDAPQEDEPDIAEPSEPEEEA